MKKLTAVEDDLTVCSSRQSFPCVHPCNHKRDDKNWPESINEITNTAPTTAAPWFSAEAYGHRGRAYSVFRPADFSRAITLATTNVTTRIGRSPSTSLLIQRKRRLLRCTIGLSRIPKILQKKNYARNKEN